jgi:Tfp pilus assembly protein PilF
LHPPCLQAWAALEGKQGDAKKAERLFEAAAKAEPGNPQLLNAWGGFEKRRGNSALARQLLEQAVAANGPQQHAPSMQARGLCMRLTSLQLSSCSRACEAHCHVWERGRMSHCCWKHIAPVCT